MFYRRRLPHFDLPGQPVFLTWRLHDSLPLYLGQPSIAKMVVAAIRFNADTLWHYALHAYVVMPNHVHLLITPVAALPKLIKSLKGATATRANALLGLTGNSFWQKESDHRLVREEWEFEEIRNYVEENPVRAGLVREAMDYPWSSAGSSAGSGAGSSAASANGWPATDQDVRPMPPESVQAPDQY